MLKIKCEGESFFRGIFFAMALLIVSMSNIFTDHFKNSLTSEPRIWVESSLKHGIDDIISPLFQNASLAIVDDKNTAEAFGDHVHKALSAKHACEHITFDSSPKADDDAAKYLEVRSSKYDVIVAVGTGTINDLCKYISHKHGKPYIVIPTAASMNGYLSANASVTFDGYKKTVPAHMPAAVLCDMSVVTAAPARLNQSGFGDSIARSTAQADWLLSHLLLGTPYDESVFAPLLAIEDELLASARGIKLSDAASLKILMNTLLLSGLGMTAAKGSYPASQGEHMIAHAYDMHLAHTGSTSTNLHGEEIAVTALAMANRQEALLNIDPIFADNVFPEARITELFGEHVAAEAKKAYAAKLEIMKNREISNWPEIASKIRKVTIPTQRMQTVLTEAGCQTFYGALGWKQDTYITISGSARFLRDRFTFLDII